MASADGMLAARVGQCLGRQPRKGDLDPDAPDEAEELRRGPFERFLLDAATRAVPVHRRTGLQGSLGFAGGKRYVLNGGHAKDAQDRAILVQCQKNLETLQKAGLQLEEPLKDLGPGSFGENVFLEGDAFSAETLCVGDELECWRQERRMPLRLQISSPRCPCGKVDQRLGKTYTLGGVRAHCARTALGGFFVRVLREGDLSEGDVLKVARRPRPQWTLARVSRLFYGHDTAVMQYLIRARKAVKDPKTDVILREEFMGSQEELIELAELPELSVFEWKEYAVKMLARPPIGRYRAKDGVAKTSLMIVGAVSILLVGVIMMRRERGGKTR